MIRGLYLNGFADDWSQCLEIRKTVYAAEYDEVIEEDEDDNMALQVILYDNEGIPVGSVRLMFDMNSMFRFDRLCVLEEHRHNGYADFIMHMIFDKSRMSGASHLITTETDHNPSYFDRYGFVREENRMILDLNEYFNKHKCCH